jgi:hypothetical protein
VVPRLEALEERLALSFVWRPQGPGPVLEGQPTGMDPQMNPQVGSLNAIAADPQNANLLYIATCSGGVWKTTNATASAPTWTPLTDNQPALDIGAIAVSPLNSKTLYAGTGNFSSGSLPLSQFFPGGTPVGVLKSTDGGNTWTVLGQSTFAGQNIRSIVPTALTSPKGQVVLADTAVFTQDPPPANQPQEGGVYLSIDGGSTWTRLSGATGSGLPNPPPPSTFEAFAASLIQDPSNPGVFYTTVFGGSANNGVYRGVYSSTTNTVTWTAANGSSGHSISTSLLNDAGNLQLAVHPNGASSTLYLLTSNSNNVSHVFYSMDQGATWAEMSTVPNINYGGRGGFLLAAAADPKSPSVVYVTGSAPIAGSLDGIVYRGDFSKSSGQWTLVVGSGATGTPPQGSGNHPTDPHSDSKALTFDANGNLLLGDDGGIYRLVNPDGANATDRYWVSVNGTLQDNEQYAVAYDSLHHIIVSGAQDDGMAIQPQPGQAGWNEGFFDDVTHVAVDDSGSTPQLYGMGIAFNFFRGPFSTSPNTLTQVQLADKAGDPLYSGLTNSKDNPNTLVAYIPFALDAVAPKQLLLGFNGLYESTDQGDVIKTRTLPNQSGMISALAYGGMANNQPNANVAYVGTSKGQVYVRTTAGDTFNLSNTFGGPILSLALDPNNWNTAFAIVNNTTLDSQVWQTTNAGQTWTNITGNLDSSLLEVDAVTVVHPTPTTTTLVVGGLGHGAGVNQGSVFASVGALSASTTWAPIGSGLPDINVQQVVYNAADNVLVAGTYGRGAWTLHNASQALQALPLNFQDLFVIGLDNQVYAQKIDPNGSSATGYFLTTPGQVLSFAAGTTAFGLPELFVLGLDNQVYAQTFDVNGNPTSGYVLTTPGKVLSFQVGSDGFGNPEVFALGLDGQVYAQKLNLSGGSASGYFLTAVGKVNGLSIGSTPSGAPELFVLGLDSQVYGAKLDASGNPASSYFLTTPGKVLSLGAGSDAFGDPLLFVQGPDGQVYEQMFNSGGSSLGGYTLTTPGQVLAFAVGHDASSHPELFALGLDHQVYAQMFDVIGNSLGGYSLTTPGGVNAVVVGYEQNQDPELFVIGFDSQVYGQMFNSNGSSISPYFLTKPGAVKGLLPGG